jgi:4-hydroxymandelate oxidase
VLDFEPLAKARLTKMAYDYVASGVANEVTLRSNVEAWDRARLRPRIMRDVSRIEINVELLGRKLPHPILLAPTAFHGLYHPEGELETVRGAAASGSILVASSFANKTVEDMARAARVMMWFQLYVQRDRGITRSLVHRAEAAGCKALCLTVDLPVRGYRDRDIRNRFALPQGLHRANIPESGTFMPPADSIYTPALEPSLSWKDVEWIRGLTTLPVLLKGIMTPEDADAAIQAGASGLIVSNHGGRTVDTVPSTAEVISDVAARIGSRIPCLVDGGIRRGTDVLKALAWGANAVLIGRPYVYALAVSGSAGIARAIAILTTELKMAMAFTGKTSLTEIDGSVIWSPRAVKG